MDAERFVKLDWFHLHNGLLFLFPFHFKGIMFSFYGYISSRLLFLNILLDKSRWQPQFFLGFEIFLVAGILACENPQTISVFS